MKCKKLLGLERFKETETFLFYIVLVLAVLIASACAVEDEIVAIEDAQMPFYRGGMMPWQAPSQYNPQGFAVDYSE
jgi:hypothetical protein